MEGHQRKKKENRFCLMKADERYCVPCRQIASQDTTDGGGGYNIPLICVVDKRILFELLSIIRESALLLFTYTQFVVQIYHTFLHLLHVSA
jgi:hypothetical protein